MASKNKSTFSLILPLVLICLALSIQNTTSAEPPPPQTATETATQVIKTTSSTKLEPAMTSSSAEGADNDEGDGVDSTQEYVADSVVSVDILNSDDDRNSSNATNLNSDQNKTKEKTTVGDEDKNSNKDGDVDKESVDDPRFTLETFVTITVTLVIVMSNCTVIIVAACTEAFNNFNKVFIYSMSLADLLVGLFVTPYSIVLSVYRKWLFASDTFCNIEAYILCTLYGAKLLSLTWLNVDHYIAVRKPERYNVMMSKTRSFCWIIISWLAAICFFMPPMLSSNTDYPSSFFNKALFLCLADTEGQRAYILTSVVLVSVPALVALIITNVYLCTKSYKKRISFYEKVFVELSNRPWNYHITCVMCIVMLLLWVPFGVQKFISLIPDVVVHDRVMFYTCWIGFCCSCSNFFVLLSRCANFRKAVWDMYCMYDWCPIWCCCCKRHRRHHYSSDVNVITLTRKR